VLEPVTQNDLTTMDAIGWNLTGSATTPPPPALPSAPTVTDQTATQTWTEGQAISLKLPANTFTDPQGEALSYTAGQASGQPLPSWLSFNAVTDSFSGTAPSTTQSLSLRVIATDTSGLSALETFSANVAAPVAEPGITVATPTPAQTWTGGQTVNLVLPGNTFTDALGLKMSFAAYQVSGTNVTSWLHFNSATDTFSGKVPVHETGSVQLEVIAKDADRVTATDLFTVTFVPAGTSHSGAELASFAALPTATVPFGDGAFIRLGLAGAVQGHE
jgi:Putative Ig domain